MDRNPVPYEILKLALYDGRVSIPAHDKLLRELQSLEKNTLSGKVDHRLDSSKDFVDALCGVVYGLTMRREVWMRHRVLRKGVPASVAMFMRNQHSVKLPG